MSLHDVTEGPTSWHWIHNQGPAFNDPFSQANKKDMQHLLDQFFRTRVKNRVRTLWPRSHLGGGGGAFKTCTLYILRSIRKEGLFCYTIHFICLQLLLKVPLGPIGNGIRSISHLSIRVGLWFGGILTCMRKRTETQTHRQTHMDATENITSCTNTGGKNVSL